MSRIFFCSNCDKEKEYFAKDLCGACYQRQWRENNPEKAKAITSRHHRKNQEKRKEEARRYYQRHSEKIKCRARCWELEHPEHTRKRKAQYYQDHQERMKEISRLWSEENPEKMREYQCHYRKRNKEKMRIDANNRRAREMKAAGYVSLEQLNARIKYYGGLCYICGGPYGEIDHVIPLSKGGSNWPANLRPICKSCNTSKGIKYLQEFSQRLSLLRTAV